MQPQRIQLKRTRGWKMPANTVVVARPSQWGNPWKVGEDGTREQCLLLFHHWLRTMNRRTRREFLKPLRGKNLACWCRWNAACHADVLLELANKGKAR